MKYVIFKGTNLSYNKRNYTVQDIFIKNGDLKIKMKSFSNDSIVINAINIGDTLINYYIPVGKYSITLCKHYLIKDNNDLCILIEKIDDKFLTYIYPNIRIINDNDNFDKLFSDYFSFVSHNRYSHRKEIDKPINKGTNTIIFDEIDDVIEDIDNLLDDIANKEVLDIIEQIKKISKEYCMPIKESDNFIGFGNFDGFFMYYITKNNNKYIFNCRIEYKSTFNKNIVKLEITNQKKYKILDLINNIIIEYKKYMEQFNRYYFPSGEEKIMISNLSLFKNEQDLRNEIGSEIKLNKECIEIINNEMINHANKQLLELLKMHQINPSEIRKSNVNTEINNEEIKSDVITGGTIGLLGASLFFGPVGIIAGGLIGALSGAIFNSTKIESKIISKIMYNQKLIQGQYEEFYKKIVNENFSRKYNNYKFTLRNCSYELKARKIKEFLNYRGIKYLIHITDKSNLNNILKYGLLPVDELKERSIPFSRNDENRFEKDGMKAICLSVTRENKKLINKFCLDGKMKNPVKLYIDASILFEKCLVDIRYCQTNAATKTGYQGGDLIDFQLMFSDRVSYKLVDSQTPIIKFRDEYMPKNFTTDEAAEILFYGTISPKYIRKYEYYQKQGGKFGMNDMYDYSVKKEKSIKYELDDDELPF